MTKEEIMGIWIVLAVVCGLLLCGAGSCLVREKQGRTGSRGYYIGRELRHGLEWLKLIVRG